MYIVHMDEWRIPKIFLRRYIHGIGTNLLGMAQQMKLIYIYFVFCDTLIGHLFIIWHECCWARAIRKFDDDDDNNNK